MRNCNLLRVLRETLALVLLCILSLPSHGQSTANPARVNLTGIIGLVKPARVLLEVEQTGQPPQRLSLREGEQAGGIELLSVDAVRNRVRIRNAGVEQELSFVSNRAQPTPPPPADARRTWDATTGKPLVEPQVHTSAPPQPHSVPIVVGLTQDRAALPPGPRVPGVTIVGRRERTPIPSMLGPRPSGPGHGPNGDSAPPLPTRSPRTDGFVDVQPQEPQFPDLPPLPEPMQPAAEPTELPSRRLREVQFAEQMPRLPELQPLPPPPAPGDPRPAPTPALPMPGVGYQLPIRTQPGYGGGYIGGSVGSSRAVSISHPYLNEGYGGYMSPGVRPLPPRGR